MIKLPVVQTAEASPAPAGLCRHSEHAGSSWREDEGPGEAESPSHPGGPSWTGQRPGMCAGPAGPDLPGGPSLDHSHTETGAKHKLLVLSHGLREGAVTQHYYGDSCDTDEVPEGNNR